MDAIRATLEAAATQLRAGRTAEAEALYRRVLELNPDEPDAIHTLGILRAQANRVDEGLQLLARSLVLAPASIRFLKNYATVLRGAGRSADAVPILRRIIELGDSSPAAQLDLAAALVEVDDPAGAEAALRRLTKSAPDFAPGHCNLGLLFSQRRRHAEAIPHYRRSIVADPNLAVAHFSLAMSLRAIGEFQTALAELRIAIQLDPRNLHAHNQLAGMLADTGDIDGALREYRELLRLDPSLAGAHGNVLFALHCHPTTTPQMLFDEHVKFGKTYMDSIPRLELSRDWDKGPDRKLRIGYVSPDFRDHSVAAFIAPIFQRHDRAQFEIFAYADLAQRDSMTDRFSRGVDHWREITGWDNPRVAEQIRGDRIDILVDLAGHTRENRLFVFARKPAPIQVTWIGYPNTTGVKAIDYRITDAITDPPPDADERHVERLVRLLGCFLCYAPPTESVEPGQLPLIANGFVTFGAFNRMAKVSDVTVELWATVLARVPRSKLLLKGDGLTPGTAPVWLDRLARFGIDPARIETLERLPSKREHFDRMRAVDIALDTYPYNGTTMTCEWLWMGVPVINLAGQTHASRVGKTLLTATGLPELSADTPDRYIDLAVEWANDVQKLTELRRSLRSRLLQSPLTDAPAFTRQLEDAYHQMWRSWCAKPA